MPRIRDIVFIGAAFIGQATNVGGDKTKELVMDKNPLVAAADDTQKPGLTQEELQRQILELQAELSRTKAQYKYVDLYFQYKPAYVALDYTPDKGGGNSSGVIIELEKYGKVILTCAHNVVDDMNAALNEGETKRERELKKAAENNIKIAFPSGKTTTGKVLVIDGKPVINPENDLAIVIPKDGVPDGAKALPVAKKTPEIGTQIIMIANHGGDFDPDSISFRIGKLESAETLRIGKAPYTVSTEILQQSGNSGSGDSGGPVIDYERSEIIASNNSNSDGDSKDGRGTGPSTIRNFLETNGLKLKE